MYESWHGNPPANASSIADAERRLGAFPRDYRVFLLKHNGGEGPIGKTYLALWRVEDLVQRNEAYCVTTYAPGLLLFGSDGGGEGYGFDTRKQPGRVVMIPFILMTWLEASYLSGDFAAFMKRLEDGYDPSPD